MRVFASVAIIGCLVLTGHAQAVRSAAADTAVITGRVTTAETGAALPYARITAPDAGVSVRTDRDGRFSISLPSPRAHVVATKAGYAPVDVTLSRGGPPRDIKLDRAAVIAGRAFDAEGDPVVGARVSVEARLPAGGSPTAIATTETDDRGEYRVGGLKAGTFVVGLASASAGASAPPKTYFPGAEQATEAAGVRVAPGDVRDDIDFILRVSLVSADVREAERRLGAARPLLRGTRNGVLMDLKANQLEDRTLRGGASVRGRVIGTDGRGIANAQVQLVMEDQIANFLTQSTDNEGHFEFAGLPAATFRLQAFKIGYSPLVTSSSAPYFTPNLGPPFEVTADHSSDGRDITLARWGVVTGYVLDEYGDPVAGAKVQLFEVRYQAGRRGLVAVQAAGPRTNDRGMYRLYDVAAGQYLVSADVGDVTSADVPGYVRSYFPGTPIPAQAQFVALRRSQEMSGLDFTLTPGRTARVSGRLLDAAGQATTGGALTLLPSRRAAATIGIGVGARILTNGSFEFINVPPGQYVIQASRGRRGASVEGEFGAWPVQVGEADVSDLLLRMSAGSTVTGRVSFDTFGQSTPRLPAGLEIVPVPVDADQSPSAVATADVLPDGRFTLAGINGPRRLAVLRTPPGWGLKQILLNGIDVTDQPMALGRANQSLTGVEVVLTDRISEVIGRVTDTRARPVGGASVVVFSADSDRWYPQSRFTALATAGPDGTFRMTGLPWGIYHAVAVPQLPEGENAWQDPVFLDALSAGAVTMTLGDAQRLSVNLRLVQR